jgi:ParB/RepB/Spo0J family partition protein
MAKAKKLPEALTYRGVLVPINIMAIDVVSNTRKHFNEDDIVELSNSIKQVGILQPLVVHKSDEDISFALICGERRLRAAMLAGIAEVPCMVYDSLPDDVVLEMQITENLQRKNINVMEESDAFQQLVSRGISTPELIADKLGTSVRYVYDRLILQKVIEDVQAHIRSGKFSISHGKQFARLPYDDQMKLWLSVENDETLTADDIKQEILSKFDLKLENAPFDIESKKLVKKAGSCIDCAKRTGCRLVLFEDVRQDDLCLDEACYNSKVNAFIEQKIEQLKKEGKTVKMLTAKYKSNDEHITGKQDWQRSESEEETDSVGIIVEAQTWDERKVGDIIYLQPEEEEQEDDEDDQDDDAGGRNTKSSKSTYVNHEEEFCLLIAAKLCNKYEMQNDSFPDKNLNELIKEQLTDNFWRLEEYLQEVVFKVLDIEKIKASDDDDQVEFCVKTSMEAYLHNHVSEAQLPKIVTLIQALHSIDSSCYSINDSEEAAELSEELQPIGLNLYSILDEYRNGNSSILDKIQPVEAD